MTRINVVVFNVIDVVMFEKAIYFSNSCTVVNQSFYGELSPLIGFLIAFFFVTVNLYFLIARKLLSSYLTFNYRPFASKKILMSLYNVAK